MGLISESHPINGTTPGNDAITEQGRQCPRKPPGPSTWKYSTR